MMECFGMVWVVGIRLVSERGSAYWFNGLVGRWDIGNEIE